MSDHDPLCAAFESDDSMWAYCECDLIAKVRADERERIAQEFDLRKRAHSGTERRLCYEDAARIVRGGDK